MTKSVVLKTLSIEFNLFELNIDIKYLVASAGGVLVLSLLFVALDTEILEDDAAVAAAIVATAATEAGVVTLVAANF